ncbi:unnamed protein product, partial [Adineta steineri]
MLHFSNVILPNGTWLINYDNILNNGDAETQCYSSRQGNTISDWSIINGSPIMYYHKKVSLRPENSITGDCSFKCADADEQMCIMERRVTLDAFVVFVNNNESQFSISAYFGSDGECAANSTDVVITNYNPSTAKPQLSNP